MSIKLTMENFNEEVMKSEAKVVIDFWAKWCGPCRMLLPIVDELSKELNEVKVCKVDIDEQPELASKFQIMAIPTVLIVKDGKIENRLIGLQEKKTILEAINA